MKPLGIIKTAIIILFFVLLAGDYFSLFENRQITERTTLFGMRHYLVIIYILIRVFEYLKTKKQNDKA